MTEAETTRILVADDDGDVLHALRLLLKGEGYEVETATSPAGVMALVESSDFDAALLDLNYARDTTSGREGIELVARLRALDSTLPVIVMTAWGSVEGAVAAVRSGARDYIEKPWNNTRLLATLRSPLELSRALVMRPKLLLVDEPSIGLEPKTIELIFDVLRELRDREGLAIVMVEQNAKKGLELADIGCVVVAGEVAMVGTGQELLADPAVGRLFLGG